MPRDITVEEGRIDWSSRRLEVRLTLGPGVDFIAISVRPGPMNRRDLFFDLP